jgi:tetratricopeptide (TPR) repeat protein
MSAPVSRPRLAGLVLWISLAGCGAGPDVPAPPRPDLEGFDPASSERIEAAIAALESERENGSAWAELGMVYDSERLRLLALECYDVAERLEPRQPRWPYRSAVALARLGRTDEAIAAIERSLALEPEYPPSHYRLGLYRLGNGDLERAEAAFRTATELDSVYPGGWIGLARVHLQRDEDEAAIAILEQLAEREPDDTTVRQLLSNAYRQAGRTTEFEAQDVLTEEDVPVWNDPWELEARRFRRTPTMLLVGQAMSAGRPEEALDLLERARAEGVGPDETNLPAARAYLALERFDEAQAELDAALEREPRDTGALTVLASLHQNRARASAQGQESAEAAAAVIARGNRAALEVMTRVTELSPTFGGAWAARGVLEKALEEDEAALASLDQALHLGADVHAPRVQVLITLGRWSEVEETLEPYLEAHPEDGQGWAQLALARNRLGNLEGARTALERARAAGGPASLLRNVGAAIERKERRVGAEDGQ